MKVKAQLIILEWTCQTMPSANQIWLFLNLQYLFTGLILTLTSSMLIDISRMISKFLYRIYKISCLCSFLSSPGSSAFNPFLLFGFSITNSRRKCISYVFSQERVVIWEKVVWTSLEKVVYQLNLRCLISWISYLSSKVEISSWFLLQFWNVNLEREFIWHFETI